MSIRKSLDSWLEIPNSHLLAQAALTVFKPAGLVVLVCDVQARDRR
jgi:hypothetical protein